MVGARRSNEYCPDPSTAKPRKNEVLHFRIQEVILSAIEQIAWSSDTHSSFDKSACLPSDSTEELESEASMRHLIDSSAFALLLALVATATKTESTSDFEGSNRLTRNDEPSIRQTRGLVGNVPLGLNIATSPRDIALQLEGTRSSADSIELEVLGSPFFGGKDLR
jgi:hypothetical protein